MTSNNLERLEKIEYIKPNTYKKNNKKGGSLKENIKLNDDH